MPLKIRCPHCHRILVAEDETAGQQKACPACGGVFNVPLPDGLPVIKRAVETKTELPKCPQCGTEVAPTSAYCHKCFTDLKTGKRLPLGRRLRLMPVRVWAIGGFATAAVVLLILGAVRLYHLRNQPAAAQYTPVAASPIPAAERTEALFAATTPAELDAAAGALHVYEPQIAPAVASALAASLDQGRTDDATQRARVVAIDVLARCGDANAGEISRWRTLLERCQPQPALYRASLRARAMLGDAQVLPALTDVWLNELRQWFFLERVVQAGALIDEPGVRLALTTARDAARRYADGLRALAALQESLVYNHLTERYWDTWSWLGQEMGDRYADEVFDLARPGGESLEFQPESVRQPRDVLRRVSENGSPAARAAAGLILYRRGPQYRSLCQRICETLAQLLPNCSPIDQQRLTWTITHTSGRLFRNVARANPVDVQPAEIAAAMEWARPGQPPKLAETYPGPPTLAYHAVTVERQVEGELLTALRGGWPSATATIDRWVAARLGVTPEIRRLLDATQPNTNPAALAACFVIVAELDDTSVRSQLELWHEAPDQPAWVRALAYCVLGSLDARTGRWDSGWPAGLDLGDLAQLDAGHPGWDYFGRVLAAGGDAMIQRLRDFRRAPLTPVAQTKLLEAARQAQQRPRTVEGW